MNQLELFKFQTFLYVYAAFSEQDDADFESNYASDTTPVEPNRRNANVKFVQRDT